MRGGRGTGESVYLSALTYNHDLNVFVPQLVSGLLALCLWQGRPRLGPRFQRPNKQTLYGAPPTLHAVGIEIMTISS